MLYQMLLKYIILTSKIQNSPLQKEPIYNFTTQITMTANNLWRDGQDARSVGWIYACEMLCTFCHYCLQNHNWEDDQTTTLACRKLRTPLYTNYWSLNRKKDPSLLVAKLARKNHFILGRGGYFSDSLFSLKFHLLHAMMRDMLLFILCTIYSPFLCL